jgi:hypothetical protein
MSWQLTIYSMTCFVSAAIMLLLAIYAWRHREAPGAAQYQAVIERARALYAEKRFFHWDLEFPEVFVDLRARDWAENPGFDAVIGNPPYDVKTTTGSDPKEVKYLNSEFESAAYKVNVFGLFIEQGIQLCADSGLFSMIIPNTLLSNRYFQGLRRQILTSTTLNSIVRFKDMPFEDATVETVILVLENGYSENENLAVICFIDSDFELDHEVHLDVLRQFERAEFRISWMPDELAVWQKMRRDGLRLDTVYDLYNGIKTTNNVEMLDDKSHGRDWKQVIRGSDVTPYLISWDHLFVNFDTSRLKSGFDETKHLAETKVVIRRADNRMIAAIDEEQYYALDTLHIATRLGDVSEQALTTILNSSLATWWLQLMQRESGIVLPEVKIDFLSGFPIRRIAFTTPPDERARLAAEGRDLAHHATRNT